MFFSMMKNKLILKIGMENVFFFLQWVRTIIIILELFAYLGKYFNFLS